MQALQPKAILFCHEIEALQISGCSSGVGVAHLRDEQEGIPEVIHLSLAESISYISDKRRLPLEWYLKCRNGEEQASRMLLPHATVLIDTESSPARARCVLRLSASQTVDCTVEIVQTGAQAFTRNAPILETGTLAHTTVLCIGLGSGGSAVIDQLARSGVGRFILWDMDRIEAHNVGRHVCTLRDLGRRKVFAVRDHILAINPMAKVDCFHKDVLQQPNLAGELDQVVMEADCVIVGTDNNASRFAINDSAWRSQKTALYGRAFTRASGGDVIQVIPPESPCYSCHVGGRIVTEEISSTRDVVRVAYADKSVPIEPGLIIDIQPIANMIARLCLLRLCEKFDSSLKSFASEMTAPLYLWANRREDQFVRWQPMERSYDRLSVLRWYAISVPRDKECPTCGNFGAA
ncbi:MAG: ThiF family adenylyltransferase [Nitrospira sp.]|nr:ThiF family adenylyltransferase [Nitrospira sp.]